MRSTFTEAERIVASLSTPDKIRVLSGSDFWNTESVPGAPSVMVTDGPHGLRKQNGDTDHVGLSHSVAATCFPTASALGSTWDRDLLREIGAALGRECRAEDVAVLLGPGLNLKRHPAGGRNFEYFSEDPLLSGHMAAALTQGVQSQGVGACLKHYAVNNQESNRLRVDAVVDERTLRELYLTGFEIAVREGQPWSVMSSYNLVNGTHAGESRDLLTEILRDDWGFDGLVMTDWLATYDRVAGVQAGLDLEMPSSGGLWDAEVAAALQNGSLPMAAVDLAVTRVVDLSLRARAAADAVPQGPVDFDAHHALARRAGAAGAVLLTNNGILPLAASGTVAIIGAFAETPRYQGAGSSLVKPTRVDTALEAFRVALEGKAAISYAPGYDAKTGETTELLLADARAAAASADSVVLLVGLPGSYESEGYDRDHLDLPAGHTALVEAVTAANPATVVVLVNGAAVDVPWADKPAAILEAYLGGQAAGGAIADVVLGLAEPGGRLAESFPVAVTDLPAAQHWHASPTQAQYREGLYAGYRFHDSAGVPARFPFGHGLSYTSFEYGDVAVRPDGDGYRVTVNVTNTGDRAGSDVVQVYVRDVESSVYRPAKELKAFAKVNLGVGESRTVELSLDRRAFAVWDVASAGWAVEAGEFEVMVGASSVDIRARSSVTVDSADAVGTSAGPAGFVATDAEFAALLGKPIPVAAKTLPFTLETTIRDLRQSLLGKALATMFVAQSRKAMPSGTEEDMEFLDRLVEEMPLRGIAMASGGRLSLNGARRMVRALNAFSVKAWFSR
jgi:beta-glucosidase